MKKYDTTIYEGTVITKCFIEARPQIDHSKREHVRVSVLWKQTYYNSIKQQEEVDIICSTTINIICTSIILQLLSLYLRRV